MNPEQLKAWYEKLTTLLIAEAQLDLREPKHLGRVMIAFAPEGTEETVIPDSYTMRYAFLPREGSRYTSEPPEEADLKATQTWLSSNMNPDRTDEQLQELYNQAAAGNLVVFRPGSAAPCQILVDESGNPKMGPVVPEDVAAMPPPPSAGDPPKVPVAPIEPPPFSQPAPVQPEEPAYEGPRAFPGLLSFLSYHILRNRDNDYGKYLNNQTLEKEYLQNVTRYEQEHAEYQTARNQYRHTATAYRNAKLQYDRDMNDYPSRKRFFDQRVQRVEQELFQYQVRQDARSAFLKDPANRKLAAFVRPPEGADLRTHDDRCLANAKFWDRQFYDTDLRRVLSALDFANSSKTAYSNVDENLPYFFGTAPQPSPHLQRSRDFLPESIKLPPIEVPQDLPEPLRSNSWIAAYAACSDLSIYEKYNGNGLTTEENRLNRYSVAADDAAILCRRDNPALDDIRKARVKGQELLNGYASGSKEALGHLLGESVRLQLKSLCDADLAGTTKPFQMHVMSHLLHVMDQDPDLLQHAKLSSEDLTAARGYVQLGKIAQEARNARVELLEAAAKNQSLDPARKRALVLSTMKEVLVNAVLVQHVAHESTLSTYRQKMVPLKDDVSQKRAILYNSKNLESENPELYKKLSTELSAAGARETNQLFTKSHCVLVQQPEVCSNLLGRLEQSAELDRLCGLPLNRLALSIPSLSTDNPSLKAILEDHKTFPELREYASEKEKADALNSVDALRADHIMKSAKSASSPVRQPGSHP